MDFERAERRDRIARLQAEDRASRPGWGVALFILACLGLGLWWRVSIWDECRAAGFSRFYCFHAAAARS